MGRNNSNRGSGNQGRGGGGKGKAMKYEIRADIKVNGTVQRKDIIGAIMGQTEGLLGDELELRKLQRTARVGHVDVEMETKNGKVHGTIIIPSSMDNVETAIIASSLETIDRIGPAMRSSRSRRSATFEPQSEPPWLTEQRNSCSPWSTPAKRRQNRHRRGPFGADRWNGQILPRIDLRSERRILVLAHHRRGSQRRAQPAELRRKERHQCGRRWKHQARAHRSRQRQGGVTVAIDGDRGGEMLFMQLYDMMKVDHVAQAPVGQEWELLPLRKP